MNIRQYRKHIFFFFLLFCLNFFVYSNPFTGNKNSPTPVYQKAPSKNLLNIQRLLNTKLGNYINEWKNEKSSTILFSILGIAFLYGIVHATGPGHRKTIVFSFYLTRKAKPIEPFLTGLQLAALHGGSATVLMLIFKGVTGAVSARSNNTMIYMEGLSFIILILLSLYGIIEAVLDILKKSPDVSDKKNLKLRAVLLSGIYPCPAAMLVLILAVNLNILGLGIISVIVMSIGMSIPIIISAYLAWAGRTGLFYKLKSNEKIILLISTGLQILGYGFLLFISVKTALPFLIGLFKKCFF